MVFFHWQAQGVGGMPLRYHNMTDVLRKTVANEGVLGLYKVGIHKGSRLWECLSYPIFLS